jgi:hypothetical protein
VLDDGKMHHRRLNRRDKSTRTQMLRLGDGKKQRSKDAQAVNIMVEQSVQL